MRYLFLLFLLFLNSLNGASNIPTKREFPVVQTIEPCENFYDHACTKVISGFTLREDRSRHVFAFHDSAERLLEAKKKFLANLKKGKSKNARQENIKNLYGACLNEKERSRFEKDFVLSTLRFVKGIPKIEKLQDLWANQAVRGEEYTPLYFDPIPNLDKPKSYDLLLLAEWLSLPERTYYEKEDVVHDLISLVKDFFEALKEPNAQQRAESVVQFQIDSSKTTLLPVELRDRISTKNEISRAEAEKKWPALKLGTLFNKLPPTTTIRNLSPENFTWLQESMSKVPLQVFKDAYLFMLLSNYMDTAYPDFYKKMFEFKRKHLGGPEKRPVRQEECTTFVMDHYTMELDHEILPTLFSNFPEDRITQLAEKVRQSILKGIESATWLSESGKKGALEKIRKAVLHVVKPKTQKDWNFLPPAKFSPQGHYENLRQLSRLETQKKWSRFLEGRNENEWDMGPLTVNAYYSPSDNKFVLPIGILQYPLFDPSLSDEAILGAMGSVIGHELGHAVDDKGSKFNAQGQLVRWMSESDIEGFNSRVKPLVKRLEEEGFEPGLKLGEYIGDLTGASFAYQAAFPNGLTSKEKGKDFFLQYARLWCEVSRPAYIELLKKTDPHPPGRFRTNEVLKHLKGFKETYGCKDGSPLSEEDSKRVRVWN